MSAIDEQNRQRAATETKKHLAQARPRVNGRWAKAGEIQDPPIVPEIIDAEIVEPETITVSASALDALIEKKLQERLAQLAPTTPSSQVHGMTIKDEKF